MLVLAKTSSCPYCGEVIELMVDASINEQYYIEDCEVCCRPINVVVHVDAEGCVELKLSDENSC